MDFSYLNNASTGLITLIQTYLIPLVFALALLLFFWGMFRFFIYGGHDDEERKKGKSLMIWAVVGFVMMVSIWGIVRLITSGLGLNENNAPPIPTVPGARN